MQNLEILNQARQIAQALLKQAAENEPQIISDLRTTAREISAEIVGLEHKFKAEESLVRKLLLLAEKDNSNQSIGKKMEKVARRNNDALRYTFVFQTDEYADGFQHTIEKLRQRGFVIPPNRIWNAWENAETPRDTGYRGINITVISSQNQRFELQFHTAESFRLKTETHHLYEKLRDLETFDIQRTKIIKELVNSAQRIERPEGI